MTVVTVQRDEGGVRATLNIPERGNALRGDLLDALAGALDLAEGDPDCRTLVLDSSSERFCLGMDLESATGTRAWHDGGVDGAYWRLLRRLADTPVVTVAIVDGAAVGGGVGLACACDLVVAGDAATFRLTEVLLKLVPGMMLPSLARRVGEQYAYRMALLADEIGPAEAVRAGLADLHLPRAADGAGQVLRKLRRTDRATLAELKSLRRLLFPAASAEYGQHAGQLLGRRLDDPQVRDRISRLRGAGMLR